MNALALALTMSHAIYISHIAIIGKLERVEWNGMKK